MNVVYGVKKKSLDDLLESFSYNPLISSFCMENKDLIYKELHSFMYSIHQQEVFGCCEVMIDFFPLSIIDKMIKKSNECKAIKDYLKDCESEANAAISKLKDNYSMDIEVSYNLLYKGNRIKKVPNVAFVYLGKILQEIRIGIPNRIEAVINLKQSYECCLCGKTIKVSDDSIPNFMYGISHEHIKYYCINCSKHINNLVHVGDFLSKTIY